MVVFTRLPRFSHRVLRLSTFNLSPHAKQKKYSIIVRDVEAQPDLRPVFESKPNILESFHDIFGVEAFNRIQVMLEKTDKENGDLHERTFVYEPRYENGLIFREAQVQRNNAEEPRTVAGLHGHDRCPSRRATTDDGRHRGLPSLWKHRSAATFLLLSRDGGWLRLLG